MFFALAGPILLLIGGLLFAVHNPQNLVSGNARLVSVQSNRYWPDPLPETYSWCRYSLLVDCPPDQFNVPTRARRDDVGYNGLTQVSRQRCFDDLSCIATRDAAQGGCGSPGLTAADCLLPNGDVGNNCSIVIEAYYDAGNCANGVWTLNNPEESITRFIIILSVGGGAFLLGWVPMVGLWLSEGCPTDADEIHV